jgi:hypothetical protein
MRYIIIPPNKKVFMSDWFEKGNHFIDGMLVIDTAKSVYTTDGERWNVMEYDHL